MNIETFADTDQFVNASVDYIRKICLGKGAIQIGLSGGNTPIPIYRALSERKDIPFERMEIYQVDERYVRHD
ncbi:MAG: 6-phosphogluconolactonase, partial [Candidatus Peregrinibacteria bacterium]|nr:6-phosphogluconolactonase [Candidatus Peregrinibacteria bacterium]